LPAWITYVFAGNEPPTLMNVKSSFLKPGMSKYVTNGRSSALDALGTLRIWPLCANFSLYGVLGWSTGT
jgi:hypothetical protein